MLCIRIMEKCIEHHTDDAPDHEGKKAPPHWADALAVHDLRLRFVRQRIGPGKCHLVSPPAARAAQCKMCSCHWLRTWSGVEGRRRHRTTPSPNSAGPRDGC